MPIIDESNRRFDVWITRLTLYIYTKALSDLIDDWAGSVFNRVIDGVAHYSWLQSIVSLRLPDDAVLSLVKQSRQNPHQSSARSETRAIHDGVVALFLRRLLRLGWVVERTNGATRIVCCTDQIERRKLRDKCASYYFTPYNKKGQALALRNWEV